MTTPTSFPQWAVNSETDPTTGAENKIEPTQEFKDSGLKREQLLPRAFVNYQFDLISQWLVELDSRTTGGASRTTTIVPDGGTLSTTTVNELQVTAAVTIPLANSVPANTMLELLVTDTHKGTTTTINRSGTDQLQDSSGLDNSLAISWVSGGTATLISNGTDTWRL